MESLTELLNAGIDLAPKQAATAVASLVSTDVADGTKMEFLKALRTKGETAGEIAAFARELLVRAVQPELDRGKLPGPAIDVCGTGGDRQGFFNVSTAVMFVAAAGGACVMKHGNRSVTSRSGAADVLEELGVKIDLTPAELRERLERHGVAFIFAPAYHPAFKSIAPVRKALATQGIPTIFNILGPLLNPARPEYQLVGIFSAELLPKYSDALHKLERTRAWAVHGNETDELTLTGESQVRVVTRAGVESLTLTPEDAGLARCEAAALHGGDRIQNALILTAVLDGSDRGPKRDMVLMNAGAALVICGIAPDLRAGVAKAAEAIDSGAALGKLNALRNQ